MSSESRNWRFFASRSGPAKLSMEEEIQPPEKKDYRILQFMHRNHILLWATIGIAFVIFLALLSQSLRNDSEISKDINKLNMTFFQKLFNNSVLEELAELKTENGRIAQNVKEMEKELHNFKADLMAKENPAASVIEDMMKLERENNRTVEAITQGIEQLYSVTVALATNRSVTPSVLEALAELKRENFRIAEHVIQVLEVVRNFSELFCTSCPPQWIHFEKNCYFFSSTNKPWKATQEACEGEGAHLVIVNTRAEQNFLVNQITSEQVFWIGLSDAGRETQWTWVDDTPLTLSFWGTGEPNNAGSGEDCATLRFNGKWNDAACSGNENWICEKKC